MLKGQMRILPNNQKFPLYISCLSDIFFLLSQPCLSCRVVQFSDLCFCCFRVFLVACHDAVFKGFDPLSNFAMYLICIRPCSCSCHYTQYPCRALCITIQIFICTSFEISRILTGSRLRQDKIQGLAQRQVFGILKQSDMITFGPS